MNTSTMIDCGTVGRQVAQRLRGALADGRLPAGDRLTVAGALPGWLHQRSAVRRATTTTRPERLPQSLAELRCLADALIRRDTRASQRLAIAHLRAAEAAALPMLQREIS